MFAGGSCANDNARIRQNTSLDPTTGPEGPDAVQLGYAAACADGASCSGNLTIQALDAPINSYCEFANRVLLSAGIPRSRVMCHTGFGPNNGGEQHTVKPHTLARCMGLCVLMMCLCWGLHIYI